MKSNKTSCRKKKKEEEIQQRLQYKQDLSLDFKASLSHQAGCSRPLGPFFQKAKSPLV